MRMNRRTQERLKRGLANPLDRKSAIEAWDRVREGLGLSKTYPRLLTKPAGNTKFAKGGQYGLCLLPHRLSGHNVCPHSTPQCRDLCINWSGRGRTDRSQNGRLARTKFLFDEPRGFARLLLNEIKALPSGSFVRLNTFSDIVWEEIFPAIFTVNPDLRFYDYTKHPVGSRNPPDNYSLTHSASERWSDQQVIDTVDSGHNVAVVFPIKRGAPMVKKWNGLFVIDGDENDSRYSDPNGVVVGLRAKGKAIHADSGFVRNV